jgi:hypothetical protein
MPASIAATSLAPEPTTQRTKALAQLKRRGMTRLSEFSAAGITATTISRLEQAGEVLRLARGLCQSPDAALDAHQSLAEVSHLVPKGRDLFGLGPGVPGPYRSNSPQGLDRHRAQRLASPADIPARPQCPLL